MAWKQMQRTTLLLWTLASVVCAHGEHGGHDAPAPSPTAESTVEFDLFDAPNYASLEAHSSLMTAHIVFMVLGWFFVLPIGVMFSIARSKLAILVQVLFLILNGLGVATGTIYNINTPDLYVNNAHHKIGWIATWIFTAQVIMSLLFVYAGRNKPAQAMKSEQEAFLPNSLQNLNRPHHKYRWSGDSGQGTDAPSSWSSARSSRTLSPSGQYDYTKPMQDEPEDLEDVPMSTPTRRPSWFRNTRFDKFLATRVPKVASTKLVGVAEVMYEVIDRTILVLGFVALTTGIVTYTGIFRANNIFNGLAHWIKGGIFFWYGLLTLGRWLGCFADFGWAWNLKPTKSQVGWKAKVPTAEFTESFVIWLYGCTNVFLEHLAAWGDAWSAQDFEHVSISIMFFGGGLAGMFVESKRLRRWLNTSVEAMPRRVEGTPDEIQDADETPKSYTTSLNIMPALIILLLGIMMSSHHQDSMLSTTVHKQWGTLLCGFSLCRAITYLLNYLSPPKSVYPTRPPTELAASFCLLAGGMIFMLSTKDVIHYMEEYDLMAMFIFTVVMGFITFLMAYTMLVVGLKGWAVRREHSAFPKSRF